MRKSRLLFLGGAPKSGTSFLFDILSQHPNICGAQPKETFYFVDANYPLAHPIYNYAQKGLAGFQQYFSPDVYSRYYLEGSTHLLYQKKVLSTLQQLDAQVLFILREPIQRLSSAFEYTKNRSAILKTDIPFETYVYTLLSGELKKIDAWVRPNVSYHFLKEELEFSTYHLHLQAWQRALGKKRVHVLQFEKVRAKPVECAKVIFQMLDLPNFEPDLQVSQHETYQIQHRQLHFYARQLNVLFPKNKFRQQLRNWYFRMQKRPLTSTTISASALASLQYYFQPHNTKLTKLADIDLTLWA
ncbi:MAG: sulfotransferase domain-containing protein [Bacteroidota bacterium]